MAKITNAEVKQFNGQDLTKTIDILNINDERIYLIKKRSCSVIEISYETLKKKHL